MARKWMEFVNTCVKIRLCVDKRWIKRINPQNKLSQCHAFKVSAEISEKECRLLFTSDSMVRVFCTNALMK